MKIKAGECLAPNWEKYVTFNDYIIWKNYKDTKLKKIRRHIAIPETYMDTATHLAESHIIYHQSPSQFYYGLINFGIIQMCLTRGLKVKIVENIKNSIMNTDKIQVECDIYNVIKKLKMDTQLADTLNLYSSCEIARRLYKECFKKDLEVSESVRPDTFFIDEIIDNYPTTYDFEVKKKKTTKPVFLYISKEIINLCHALKNIYRNQSITSILRGGFIQGLYSVCWFLSKNHNFELDYNLLLKDLEELLFQQNEW